VPKEKYQCNPAKINKDRNSEREQEIEELKDYVNDLNTGVRGKKSLLIPKKNLLVPQLKYRLSN
jgi:hypothetical protein